MSVSALVIGDPHFKISNVAETKSMVEAIIETAQKVSPNFIVVLGDTLDRHEIIHSSPLCRAVDFLDLLSRISPVYLLIGNHDLKNNREFLSTEHPFTALKYWGERLTVVDTTLVKDINGKVFTFVPYVPPGRFLEALDFSKGWNESVCIFGHQEIRGVKTGPEIISTSGDVWIPGHFGIMGHIHNYQELYIHNREHPDVVYVGSPIQHSFGDHPEKTISLFTFSDSGPIKHERIDLGLLRKLIVKISCSDVPNYIPETKCELKLLIVGTKGEIKTIKSHTNIEKWKEEGHKICYKEVSIEKITERKETESTTRFSSSLYTKIKDIHGMVPIYKEIFGEIPEAQK